MENAPTKSLRILCAEDIPELLFLVEMALKKAGHQVTSVASGQEAVEVLKKEGVTAFDKILTDNQMPHGDGLSLVTWARQNGFVGEVILLSSEVDSEVGKQYRELGVSKFLLKPTFGTRLLEALK
jgi:CheY-like chemotaxis protein